jgi:hypothetical protein
VRGCWGVSRRSIWALINYRVQIIDHEHQKLLQRPIDEDTRIHSTTFHRVGGIPFLIEIWNWEAVRGRTAVFLNEHVAGMNDADLERFLTEKGIDLCGAPTIVRLAMHTFVNFGFVAN